MKASTTFIAALSATLTAAAPTTLNNDNTNVAREANSGYIVPTAIKVHDINSNMNYPEYRTSTIRRQGTETSTLYDIPIPESVKGKTCGLIFRAAAIGSSDYLDGTKALDIFKGGFTDLSHLNWGNLRDQQLGRIKYDPTNTNGVYAFAKQDVVTKLDSFPCPHGTTLHWETVAVGEFDVNVVKQDFFWDGTHVPNGLSIRWW
ncbi:hypothetical protein Micbo1qcDRAFT_210773 [Microdochium bolleyi]|uniref:Ubiquitin 3 binding protein But2 C-terminal domain-containing protein n=1 Tax=Microdochium bolleyi TaxID=196109 RepID=A0A136JH61_9PEZI|nr:hypothetical protein Micbo1qcDRAFT_210773 [Microdochium bolleyi]